MSSMCDRYNQEVAHCVLEMDSSRNLRYHRVISSQPELTCRQVTDLLGQQRTGTVT
jgi:hypothetical protein